MFNKSCHLSSDISLATSWFPCRPYFIFPILNSSVLGLFLTSYSPISLRKFHPLYLDVGTIFSLPLFLRSRPIYPPIYCTPPLGGFTYLKFNNTRYFFHLVLKPASPFMTSTIINGTTIQAISPNEELGIIIYYSLIFILQSPTSIGFTTISYKFI